MVMRNDCDNKNDIEDNIMLRIIMIIPDGNCCGGDFVNDIDSRKQKKKS